MPAIPTHTAETFTFKGGAYTLEVTHTRPDSNMEGFTGFVYQSKAKVFGQSLNLQTGWYPAIIDVYVLDTLLADLPERVGGIRNPVGMQWHLRQAG